MSSSAPIDLDVFSRFLGAFDQSAVAHSREELTSAQIADLAAFARGELSEQHRARIIPVLVKNENAMEYLADLARGTSGGTTARGE